jgi:hypothetical protein
MFTQRHFIAIASTMYDSRPDEPLAFWQWRVNVINLARLLARHNPRFDALRFMQACGCGAAHAARDKRAA